MGHFDDNSNICLEKKLPSIPELIKKKRDGKKLSRAEIEFFLQHALTGDGKDGQIGAMLMAMFIRGIDSEETTHLTRAMTYSGDILRWPDSWKGKVIDKHSTGGVGDKVSLVLAPALAALGYKVPMVSGRGLGHTGGTIDKLESIPKFNAFLSHAEMKPILEDVGFCIVGQTSNLVPADKKLYALRDVTGTVDNVGLISASIISKKVAESLDALVLDVKCGRAAFMQEIEKARELSREMVAAGKGSGVPTVALITEMDVPIGKMIGNALEVVESIQTLHGQGPEDLVELVTELGGHLLEASGHIEDARIGAELVKETLTNGAAMKKFSDMLKAQGVASNVADTLCLENTNLFEILPEAKQKTVIKSNSAGFVHDIDAMVFAEVTRNLGAGRTKAGESINYAVGLQLHVRVGDLIEKGQAMVTIHHDEDVLQDVADRLETCIEVSQKPFQSKNNGRRLLEIIK